MEEFTILQSQMKERLDISIFSKWTNFSHITGTLQKQSFADVLQIRCSYKSRKFVFEPLFNKVAGPKACIAVTLLKRDSNTGVFQWNLRNF